VERLFDVVMRDSMPRAQPGKERAAAIPNPSIPPLTEPERAANMQTFLYQQSFGFRHAAR
jgi:hypothetical protein